MSAVNGARTYFDEAGEGVPIVCIHPGATGSRIYRHLLPLLAARGYRASAPDLPWHCRSYPAQWRPGNSIHDHAEFVHACVRTVLRLYNRHPNSEPLPPYDEIAWSGLTRAARTIAKASWAAYRAARETAEADQDPYVHGWTRENIFWLMVHHGPATTRKLGERAGLSYEQMRYRTGRGHQRFFVEAREALFPSPRVVIAYRVLFGVYSDIVPDGIADLGIDGLDWADDSAVLVRYIKGRTPEESITLPSKAVRLLERWLEYAELARSHCPPRLRNVAVARPHLASRGRRGPRAVEVRRPYKSTAVDWSRDSGVVDANGAPVMVHRHRIRTTFESRRDRSAWIGNRRSTIDPNHTPGVEGDHYLSSMTEAQQSALEDIVEQAQGDLLRRGQSPMLCRTSRSPTWPVSSRGRSANWSWTIGRSLNSWVASAMCSWRPAPIRPRDCTARRESREPARPWVCLLCPLALFTPRHAANLLRMKAFFAR
ncbi:alpha/beta hydrolase [Streptomyces sp. NPDC039016]|uniref:alpha/beta fold hydrolase n=1 Tax=Streptomyces sp. NPDC039016 TaxID=3154330 RepID=UPI0033E1AD91